MRKALVIAFIALSGIIVSSNVSAESFVKEGKIKSILVGQLYSGCMVKLDSIVAPGCASSTWVSLDCNGLFNDQSKETGKKKYASALLAAQTGRTVRLHINNSHKVNGYCVARRLDVLF